MAGSLIKIQETTVSSATASVSLVGIDSTFDVYKFVINNATPDTDNVSSQIRVTESGTPNTTANYDRAVKTLKSDSSFSNEALSNQTFFYADTQNSGTSTGEQLNSIQYIFNANNSSEFTFMTTEVTHFQVSAVLMGQQGGYVFTSASTVDGVQFFYSSGNIASGTFTLYALKK